MPELFEKIKGKVDESISKISSKSKDTVELATLRSQLRNFEKEKNRKINELGSLVYDMLRRDSYDENNIKEFFSNIIQTDKNIVTLEHEIKKIQAHAEITKVNSMASCECGASFLINQKYCSVCGKHVSDIVDKTTIPSANIKACSNCGADIKQGAKFCAKCGIKQQ